MELRGGSCAETHEKFPVNKLGAETRSLMSALYSEGKGSRNGHVNLCHLTQKRSQG